MYDFITPSFIEDSCYWDYDLTEEEIDCTKLKVCFN